MTDEGLHPTKWHASFNDWKYFRRKNVWRILEHCNYNGFNFFELLLIIIRNHEIKIEFWESGKSYFMFSNTEIDFLL